MAKAAKCPHCSAQMRLAIGLPALSPTSVTKVDSRDSAEEIIRDKDSSEDDVRAAAEYIYGNRGIGGVENLARHPNCPQDILLELLREYGTGRPEGMVTLAHERMPLHVLYEFLGDPESSTETLSFVLSNPQLDNPQMRMEMLRSDAVPADSLAHVATSRGSNEEFRELMASGKLSKEQARKSWESKISRYSTSTSAAEELCDLVHDDVMAGRLWPSHESVIRSLPYMTEAELTDIFTHDDWTWSSSSLGPEFVNSERTFSPEFMGMLMREAGRDHPVRLRHDAIPEDIEQTILSDIRNFTAFSSNIGSPVIREEALSKVARYVLSNPHMADRDAYADGIMAHPNCPKEDFRALMEETGGRRSHARLILANSRHATVEELTRLSKSTDPAVRIGVVRNPSTPDEVAMRTSGDEDNLSRERSAQARIRAARRFGIDEDNDAALDYVLDDEEWYLMGRDDDRVTAAKAMFGNREL